MIKIEFPANNQALAAAIGRALVEYGTGKLEQRSTLPAEVVEVSPGKAGNPLDLAAAVEHNQALGAMDKATATDTAGADFDAAITDNVDTSTGEINVDEKGVAFNAQFCGKAAVPFYTSGKKLGQWKKRGGVDEGEYDNWYASQLATADSEPEGEKQLNSAGAFSQQQAPSYPLPADAGVLMASISEWQTAGHITTTDVEHCYKEAGVSIPDLFNPATAAASVAAVHALLVLRLPA